MEKGNKLFHVLDRWVGIPLVLFLGLIKKALKTEYPKNIKWIGILNLGSIGDNVLMSAVITDLFVQYPDAEIVLFTGSTNYGIAKLFEGVSKVIKLPITNPIKSIRILRDNRKFDVFFDFGPWPRLNSIYTFFAYSNYKIGFKTKKQFRHFIYDVKVNHRSDVHEIDNHRNLIKSFISTEHHKPALIVEQTQSMMEFINSLGKYCIIHPWAGGLKSDLKQWDNARWKELISRISGTFDNILITGAPSDIVATAELFSLMSDLFKSPIDVSGKFSISETVCLINNCSCVISVDTGIAHITAALNRPLICLQGPANSNRWRPYNETSIVLNPERGTFGYLNYGFEYYLANGNCMDNISVDCVYQAFLSL